MVLCDRPIGVRRSWRKSTPDLAKLGELLRNGVSYVGHDWGDPIEAAEFRQRGALRRLQAAFANGRVIDISFRRDGTKILRITWWKCS